MRYLFTENGLKLLESYCFTNTVFAFDFDGTLAKIVPNPSDARMTRETSSLLSSLNKVAPVAIISGRGLRDLRTRLNFVPSFIVGNHGLEGLYSKPDSIDAAIQSCRSWKDQVIRLISKKNLFMGIEIEDKDFSLAIHYRKSRNKRDARLMILEAVNAMSPSPRVILGKSVVNLVPAGGPHKGIALLETMLQAETKSAFYIGDDDTDEDVFSLSDARVMTVRVGNKKSSQAQYFIRRQTEINRILKQLLEFLGENKSARRSRKVIHE